LNESFVVENCALVEKRALDEILGRSGRVKPILKLSEEQGGA